MVDLYYLKPSEVTYEKTLLNLTSIISNEEKFTISQFRRGRDRHSALVTRAVTRLLLSKYISAKPEDLVFSKVKNGKPILFDSDCEVRFNLSHTSDCVVWAITSGKDVGIDIEIVNGANDMRELWTNIFTPQECAYIESFSSGNRACAFFDLWTLKESFLKATGEGLSVSLGSFEFGVKDGCYTLINSHLKNITTQNYFFRSLSIPPNYRVAICVAGNKDFDLTVKKFSV
ncbi:4'-phosphopantetheinyl transferase superfamily protein [Reinekea sp. G2M2-21]|uniref:4'-phosphopantetheinyl transferase family protein n=1 Tax=Reinekea sp. G2M2-21 TaxID=2788942 RepID=UPI0018A94D6C|nr:4'-phosphopantetheinyl transferase superfamily protein [Reinekea sp. G2M2-21]